MNVDFETLRSDQAIVCHKEHRTVDGVDNIVYVLLADGWLLDCGTGRVGTARAEKLAGVINGNSPGQFSRASIEGK